MRGHPAAGSTGPVGGGGGHLGQHAPILADALRAAFLRADYRTDGVRALLGREAHAALGRGEPEPAFRTSTPS